MASSDSDATVGTIMNPITMPADRLLKMFAPQKRLKDGGEDREGDDTVDDGGHARENLQDRFDDLADPVVGVLGQIHGCTEPQRNRDQQRDHHGHQGAHHQGKDAPVLVGPIRFRAEAGRPAGAGQELDDADVLEKGGQRREQRHHDPERDRDGEPRRAGEQDLDDLLAGPTRPRREVDGVAGLTALGDRAGRTRRDGTEGHLSPSPSAR